MLLPVPLTLVDIARISGVSRSTVSRVINADPNVKERTRKKVQEVIQNLNFQPNMAARGLAAGSTRVIGLVIPVGVSSIFSDPYFPLVIQGVSSACNQLNYSIMLWLAEPKYERKTISQIIYNGLIDGVIVLSMLMEDPLIDRLSESNRPFIMIGRHPTNEKISYVDVDNRSGAYQGVSYAIRTGHRRVAFIGGPRNTISGLDRYQGYLDALQEHDLALIPELVTEGDYSDAGGYRAMKGLLPLHPDAVFTASDAMAFAAIRAIQEAGLHIPEDIAIIGFDDIPPAATSKPPLTTIQQPIMQTGKMAAEMLIDMIENPNPQTNHVVLPTELVIRSSC
ncbi:MAG: LacI family DNA-binding transcriptional regulator [Omnitrophica WOR_2 bacterium]